MSDLLRRRVKYAGDIHKALVDLGWDLETAADFLNSIPDADAVEVVHGRWVQRDLFAMYHWMYNCSCCNDPVYDPIVPPNYCPSCGAKMDGVEDK